MTAPRTFGGWALADEETLIRLIEARASYREMAAAVGRTRSACSVRVSLLRQRGTLPPLQSTRGQAARSRAAARKARTCP